VIRIIGPLDFFVERKAISDVEQLLKTSSETTHDRKFSLLSELRLTSNVRTSFGEGYLCSDIANVGFCVQSRRAVRR
jgi:hypothetical protein